MEADGYAVVFDISRGAYSEWTAALWGLGIVAGGLAGVWWFDSIWKRIATAFMAIAGVALTAAILWSQWSDYHRLQAHYRDGQYVVVEGAVQHFVRDDRSGKSPQTFEVRGRSFELCGRTCPSPAFHQTVGAGGPDLAGKCVRIAYSDRNEILWLGVRACAPEEL